jgi:toxin YoeB
MKISFTEKAFDEFRDWFIFDSKKVKKINDLIDNIIKYGLLDGIGKPERLKHINCYSREIDKFNRLLYRIDENGNLEIISCKGHYGDK